MAQDAIYFCIQIAHLLYINATIKYCIAPILILDILIYCNAELHCKNIHDFQFDFVWHSFRLNTKAKETNNKKIRKSKISSWLMTITVALFAICVLRSYFNRRKQLKLKTFSFFFQHFMPDSIKAFNWRWCRELHHM